MSEVLVRAVAEVIKDIRKQKQLSQENLAEKSELDRTYISGVERGVRNITLESLESVINALQVPLHQFLETLKEKVSYINSLKGE